MKKQEHETHPQGYNAFANSRTYHLMNDSMLQDIFYALLHILCKSSWQLYFVDTITSSVNMELRTQKPV